MLADFGYAVLLLVFGLALYAAFAAAFGALRDRPEMVESARRAMLLTFPLLTLAAGVLVYLLATGHFEVEYVYSVTSRSMPLYLKLTAWWGGQAGSLLFWSWLLSLFTSAVTLRKWDRDREFLPWVLVVTSVTLAFFIGLNVFFENPFARLWSTIEGIAPHTFRPAGGVLFTPADGRGLNPLLRHPGMVIHPPMLYLGFVSFVVPYAFAIAALVTGRTDDRWVRITRRWTLVAWLFLSLGLVLGARWAYDVLGWGGYWGWDPVEIAAFMPWLTGTAFLHSVMIEEKRNMLKQWNMLLIIMTYDLVIFGTFLTRSGVLSSVHAFAQSAIGPAFFTFIGVTLIASVGLLLYRWNDLKAQEQMTSLLSREFLFLLNNLIFLSIFVVSFWGVIFPLLSELFTGQKITVGPPFYERATAPLFSAMLFLMAIAPLSAWGRSTVKSLGRILWKPAVLSLIVPVALFFTGITQRAALIGFWLVALVTFVTVYEFWRAARARQKRWGEPLPLALWKLAGRNRRRYGGYIVHIAMALMAIGILGIEVFQTETQATLSIGESVTLNNYQVTYSDLAVFDTDDGRQVARAVLDINKDGQYIGELHPRVDFYYDSQQPMTIPGLRSTLADDLYVILVDWEPVSTQNATFKVYHNPLVKWLWIGTFVFMFGLFISLLPERETAPVAVPVGEPVRKK